MEKHTYSIPAFWASYLINSDPSGMEQVDIDQCDEYTKDLGFCVDVSETTYFGQFKGIGYELADFTFLSPIINPLSGVTLI